MRLKKEGKTTLLLLLLVSFSLYGNAKQIKAKLKIINAVINIGEPCRMALSCKHPAEMTVHFPDENYNFAPFEFEKKEWFPTKTDSLGSLDSVIYTLRFFELEQLTKYSLPVFIIQGMDTVKIFSDSAKINIIRTVLEVPENAQLKSDTHWIDLPLAKNYPYMAAILAIIAIALLITVLLSIKPIYRLIRKMTFRKKHSKFLNNWKILTQKELDKEVILAIEKTWKTHIQALGVKNATSWTNKEFYAQWQSSEIQSTLRKTEEAIFSGRKVEITKEDFLILEEKANRLFEEKLNALSKQPKK